MASKFIFEASITLIPKQENYSLILQMNIDIKIFNKMLSNRIQQHIKNIMLHEPVGFIPGYKVGPIFSRKLTLYIS